MAAEYNEIMQKLTVSDTERCFDKDFIYQGIEINKNYSLVPSEYIDALNNSRAEQIARAQQLDDQCRLLTEQNCRLSDELNEVYNSNSWKFIKKMNRRKVPFKGIIKKIFLK